MGKLKDRLIERERNLSEEKYQELLLKKENIIEWEILYSKLASIAQNARETAIRISASPVVREMGECIFALFTPEGEAIALSTGLVLHVPNKGMTIKWMLLNDYEEKVGINEGDIFFNNDPFIAGTHTPDQISVAPIFYQGVVVGWAGGLNHVPEVGAIESGGVSVLSQTRYDEGLFMPCVKIAENYRFKPDLEVMVERGIRPSVWWLLDSRARAAGLRIIEDGVKKLIEEYGIDVYRRAIYEYIEDTRQACVKKIQGTLFPGKYHAVNYLDIPLSNLRVRKPVNAIIRVPVETTLSPESDLTFDFEGASSPGPWVFNSSLPATNGNIFNQLIQMVYYDIKYNYGTCLSYRLIVPPSIINPNNLQYACGMWVPGILASGGVVECISRMYYQMGYREEVCAPPPTLPWMHVGGRDQYGRPVSLSLFQSGYNGMPASGVLDGMDGAYASYNPQAEFADAEMWEKMMPLIYLGRNIHVDSGGFGKYRGGSGIEELFMVDEVNEFDGYIDLSSLNASAKVFVHKGIMGGYPGAGTYRFYIKNSNLRDLIDKGMPLPHSEGNDPKNPDWTKLGIKGEQHLVTEHIPETEFKKYDLFQMMNNGTGGYGDPIERAPVLVKRDVELNITSIRAAEKVYSVVIDRNTLEIDYERTKELRKEHLEDRKRRGISAKEYIDIQREKIIQGGLPPKPKQCLNDCFKNSERFLKSFIEFWQLPKDFKNIP